MTQKLSGTTALVTGASSGIGAATALRLTKARAIHALHPVLPGFRGKRGR
jgi:NAD(P)-dependent dehydrogenase (short-subunit alcohol dehydrogenase family)